MTTSDPRRAAVTGRTGHTTRWLPALLAAFALSLAACGTQVRNPVTGQTERTVMDERAEIAEGAKAHAEILKETPAVKDAALAAYVDGIGQKLAAQSHNTRLKWTFTVLDSPEINAFALPGGYVYVTRGIMAYLDSEADLAGVIGHEIGHVTARHGAQRATKQQHAGLLVLGAAVLGAVLGGDAGARAAGEIGQTVAAGHVAKYGREQELQADQLGAEYLSRVRYNPQNMVDVIQVLKSQELFAAEQARAAGRAVPEGGGWLASHPSNDERLQSIRATAQKLAGASGAAAWGDEGRARYLKAVEGMAFGDSPEQGLVRGRLFVHESLGIALTAPAGWRIANDASQLVLMSAERDAALVMKLIPDEVVKKVGSDHAAILKDALGATQGTTEKLTLGGGLPATHFVGQRRNAQGQTGPLTATIVSGPANHLYLLGWATKDAQALARTRTALREAERSFRPLTAADRAAAKPWKVKVVPMPAGGFAELARRTPLTELAEQQLRLMNGAYGEGAQAPRAGQPVKVVE
ncbi:MAG: M48 family metalloprotease [Betaproteobacteria bacterium]|nr:M48 family metalloprotease [Betaproteobacteria bacterium]MCC6246284.1 M48 family metalloprotease [Rubrivivax sp.]